MKQKSNPRLTIILFILVTLAHACQTQPPQPEREIADTPSPEAILSGEEELEPSAAPAQKTQEIAETEQTPTLTATLTPQPGPLELRPQYTITATLDYAWRYLEAQEEISITNSSSDIISELTLVIQPNWHPDAFRLTHLAWDDGKSIQNYSLEGIRLRILLLDPFEPGETLRISLGYEINIPAMVTSDDFGPNPFGYTARQINLTDWYPFIPPYMEGLGWQVHNPWYYGEHLVYPAADFDITLNLINAPDSTLIAASSLDLGDNDLHRYQLQGARNFVFSVSHEYQLYQEDVGNTTVLGYAFSYDSIPGEAAFRTTVQALELFNQLYGPYPFQGMTMVQADFDHGMEYSGFYFLSKAFYSIYDDTSSTYLVAIAAHETAHQWWYGMVGNDQALEPWLDEALCTYSEKIFYQHLYPQSLEWWQAYRVDYYQPQGWVDSTIYNTNGYRPYRDAVYLNGATFLDKLRKLVGEQVFFEFIQDYLNQNKGKIATTNDFFALLDTHTEEDWATLKGQYFKE